MLLKNTIDVSWKKKYISGIVHLQRTERILEFLNVKRNGTSGETQKFEKIIGEIREKRRRVPSRNSSHRMPLLSCPSARQLYRSSSGTFRDSCRDQHGHKKTALVSGLLFVLTKWRNTRRSTARIGWLPTPRFDPGRLINIRLEPLQLQILLYKARNLYDIKMSMAVCVVRSTFYLHYWHDKRTERD